MAREQKFGKYTLFERIALGGMAEIFRAQVRAEGGFVKEAAIKRILPHLCEDAAFVTMFIEEAKLAAKLSHANIVQIFDFGSIDGAYYIAMELVEGRDLKRIAERARELGRSISPVQSAYIVAEVLRGLGYAHGRAESGRELRIVHRDVSPHNIIVSFSGEVKLSDFGIARAVSRATHTATGVLKGKIAYMSPEQARGEELSSSSDIFSAGIILWELLAGRRLFAGDADLDTLRKVQQCMVEPPSSARSSLPQALDGICMRALGSTPSQRFPDALSFERALRDYLRKEEEQQCDAAALSSLLKELFVNELEARKEGTSVIDESPGQEPSARTAPETPALLRAASVDSPTSTIKPPVEKVPTAPMPSVHSRSTAPKPPSEPPAATAKLQKLRPWHVLLPLLAVVLAFAAWLFPRQMGKLPQAPAPAPSQVSATTGQPSAQPAPPLPSAQPPAGAQSDQQTKPLDSHSAQAPVVSKPARQKSVQMPKPRATGFIDIKALPWAEVLLDGKSLGTTPMGAIEAPEGKHVLVLRNNVLNTEKTYNLVIKAGRTEKVLVDFSSAGR